MAHRELLSTSPRLVLYSVSFLMTLFTLSSSFLSRCNSPRRSNEILRQILRQQRGAFLQLTPLSRASSSSVKPPMPHDEDKMPFYALGTNLAIQVGGQANFKTLLEDDEMEVALQGFCDTLKGSATVDARTVLETYGPALNKLLQERTGSILDRVKKDGLEYIANFMDCNEEAVKTTSGLVYCEMTQGTGKRPTLQSTVEVHYHGTLTDGTVFDSSVDRGQTISFPLMGVIQGWQEGLQMMKEGGKATLVIPSDLAYADSGSGDVVPPGATLKFEVELFKVDG
jgi:FKBP-type peptidyl-prolyl cis-trans isomerase FkpA